ncbi:MAG: DUF6220 domain-containing protein [Thermomicrobiales bacterium]
MSSASETRLPRRVVWSRYTLFAFAAVFAIGAVGQFFLAGLSVFETPLRWVTHVTFGHIIGLFAALMWVPALLGRVGRPLLAATVAMVVLMVLQYAFVESGQQLIQSLHPLNGALLFSLSLWIALRAADAIGAIRQGATAPQVS